MRSTASGQGAASLPTPSPQDPRVGQAAIGGDQYAPGQCQAPFPGCRQGQDSHRGSGSCLGGCPCIATRPARMVKGLIITEIKQKVTLRAPPCHRPTLWVGPGESTSNRVALRTSGLLPQGPPRAEEHARLLQLSTGVCTHRAWCQPCLPATNGDTSASPASQPMAPITPTQTVPVCHQASGHRRAPELPPPPLPQKAAGAGCSVPPWQVQTPSQAHCSEPNPSSCLLPRAGASFHQP